MKVRIWDRATCEAEVFSKDEIVVVLRGERLEGGYAIFRRRDGEWLIHRTDPQI